jgi:hypothetical protein
MRALWLGDPEMEYNRTDQFKISSVPSVEENLPPGYSFEKPYPNPNDGKATIKFRLPSESKLKIAIVNLGGEEIKTIADRIFPAGENTLEMYMEELPSGLYMINITSEKVNIIRRINRIK